LTQPGQLCRSKFKDTGRKCPFLAESEIRTTSSGDQKEKQIGTGTVTPVTEYTRQDLGRKYSILQYVTITLDVYKVCHCVGRCVKNGSCSSSRLE